MKENIWRYIATAALSGVFTLAAAQFMHVKDEVSHEEVDAIVQAKTQKLSDEMETILEHSTRTDSTMTVISEQLKHFRVKATWYSVQ